MTKQLHIARDLSLPLDYVTKTVGILAQRRKGKTYTANVIAEEFVAAGLPFVALDPTGAWWGLRASADGQGPGLPVTILGGEHGDVPLNRTDGKGVAELVVDEPGWYVIDFSLFESNAAEVQFATDFGQRLYRRKGQPNSDFPMHLFVDEADRFVPQKPMQARGEGSETTMLGAFEAIVRRGGLRGLGTTLISQRSAVVNKNVLEQCDVMIVLRTVGPNDRDRIIEIVSGEGTKEQIAEVKSSMASLDVGEAWFWEPGEGIFQRIHVRERQTFNSSATPKPGEKRVEPRRLASVDLEAIKERWEATIERAKADDPKELRKQIAERDRQIKQLQQDLAARPSEREIVEIEVPIVPAEVRDTVVAIGDLADRASINLQEAIAKVFADILEQTIGLVAGGWGIQVERTASVIDAGERFADRSSKAKRAAPTPPAAVARRGDIPTAPPPERTNTREDVNEPRQRILDAIAWYNSVGVDTPRRGHVAFVAGTSPASSGFEKNFGALRTVGLVHYPEPGTVALTPDGAEVARPTVQISTTAELIAEPAPHGRLGGISTARTDGLMARCTATAKSSGEQCRRQAHPGSNVCVKHGAGAPQVRAASARRVALSEALGAAGKLMADLEISVEGLSQFEVLEQSVHRSALMARVFDHLVSTLDTSYGSKSIVGPDHLGDLNVHPYVTLHLKWTTEAARISKLAVEAGLDERRVQLAEQQGRLIAEVLRTALDGFVAELAAAGLAVDVVRRVYRDQVPALMRGALEAASTVSSGGGGG